MREEQKRAPMHALYIIFDVFHVKVIHALINKHYMVAQQSVKRCRNTQKKKKCNSRKGQIKCRECELRLKRGACISSRKYL